MPTLLLILLELEEHHFGKGLLEQTVEVGNEIASDLVYSRLKFNAFTLSTATIKVLIVPLYLLFLVNLNYFELCHSEIIFVILDRSREVLRLVRDVIYVVFTFLL